VRILILGSRGFIGSSLANLLEIQGNEVKTLSRGEFNNNEKLKNLMETSDVVINCIGSANVGFSYTNTSEDFESNVGVVRAILEILREQNFNHVKFINLSSASVYGNPKQLPVQESDPIQPLSPYGFHKTMAELLLTEYSHCFDLKTMSLRIFSAYGNGQKKLLLWDLHEKIQKSNGIINLFGTGNESRDFIHIEDIAHQILLAVDNADFVGEAINVANGVEVKISEIVELYQKYYPQKFDCEFNGEVRLGDPVNWCADISLMRNWDYQSKIVIEQGIKSYINWAIYQQENA
jgi:UDP-glucose 4-epimerase